MKLKITGGLQKGRFIDAPKGSSTRPTSEKLRKTFFDILRDRVENAIVIDFFAGSGAVGIEALSRGAAAAYFIDNDHHAIATIHHNLKMLDLASHGYVYKLDGLKAVGILLEKGVQADVIFIDPPYAKETGPQGLGERLIGLIDRSPILKQGGLILLEEGRYFDDARCNTQLTSLRLMSKRGSSDTSLYLYEKMI